MQADRKRLQDWMTDQRGDMTWEQIAVAMGVTAQTVRRIRDGKTDIPEDRKRGLEEAYRVPHGTVDAVLEGRPLPEAGVVSPLPAPAAPSRPQVRTFDAAELAVIEMSMRQVASVAAGIEHAVTERSGERAGKEAANQWVEWAMELRRVWRELRHPQDTESRASHAGGPDRNVR